MSVVDTNILVHATSAASTQHEAAVNALIRFTKPEPIAISRQVLREYISVVTGRGFNDTPVSLNRAMLAVAGFQRMFRILEDSAAVWDEFAKLTRTVRFAGKQIYDANLVATMLAYGETKLLTFNARHFHRFEPLIEVVVP